MSVAPTWRRHAPEYLAEALCLGLFMLSAGGFGIVLEHPDSFVRAALPDAFLRRVLMGLAMGATAVLLIHSPFGKRSGAHMNPAVTLAFYRLGRIRGVDAILYVLAQFLGGVAGLLPLALLARPAIGSPAVAFVATRPGASGVAAAFLAEAGISFLLLLVLLHVMARPRTAPFTGLCAGALVALFIAFEAPFSGMSMNPARTFASAVLAGDWTAGWVYFTAPPLGMLAAAALHDRSAPGRVRCAKLRSSAAHPCIFCEGSHA